jgi:CheY-like chemotaxis protein
MDDQGKQITILLVDDDPDDRLLARDAIAKHELKHNVQFLENGEELLDYLKRRGKYEDPKNSPTPGLILLDIRMPKMDGTEALKAIRNDQELRNIPVVMLSTSRAEEEIFKTYDLGANSFICKPVTFDGLVEIMGSLTDYWFETVQLPKGARNSDGQS